MEMQKSNYKNEELNVQINCYIDNKNQIWFRGKEIALILDYKDTKRAIKILGGTKSPLKLRAVK